MINNETFAKSMSSSSKEEEEDEEEENNEEEEKKDGRVENQDEMDKTERKQNTKEASLDVEKSAQFTGQISKSEEPVEREESKRENHDIEVDDHPEAAMKLLDEFSSASSIESPLLSTSVAASLSECSVISDDKNSTECSNDESRFSGGSSMNTHEDASCDEKDNDKTDTFPATMFPTNSDQQQQERQRQQQQFELTRSNDDDAMCSENEMNEDNQLEIAEEIEEEEEEEDEREAEEAQNKEEGDNERKENRSETNGYGNNVDRFTNNDEFMKDVYTDDSIGDTDKIDNSYPASAEEEEDSSVIPDAEASTSHSIESTTTSADADVVEAELHVDEEVDYRDLRVIDEDIDPSADAEVTPEGALEAKHCEDDDEEFVESEGSFCGKE